MLGLTRTSLTLNSTGSPLRRNVKGEQVVVKNHSLRTSPYNVCVKKQTVQVQGDGLVNKVSVSQA